MTPHVGPTTLKPNYQHVRLIWLIFLRKTLLNGWLIWLIISSAHTLYLSSTPSSFLIYLPSGGYLFSPSTHLANCTDFFLLPRQAASATSSASSLSSFGWYGASALPPFSHALTPSLSPRSHRPEPATPAVLQRQIYEWRGARTGPASMEEEDWRRRTSSSLRRERQWYSLRPKKECNSSTVQCFSMSSLTNYI
jgi:hypothetical protein